MNIHDILVHNSFSISGSFEVPIVDTTSSISTDLPTGSLFFDKSQNFLFVASGSTFHNVALQTDPIPPDYDIEYLVVGGGGGGGMDMGGGGGAGGFATGSFTTGTGITYNAEVGAGGTGAPAGNAGGQPSSHQFTIAATNGASSSLSGGDVNISRLGGGFGGSSYYNYTPGADGGDGASGGGSSGYSSGGSTYKDGGDGTAGQGNNGGRGGPQYYSGGGGGAGAVGVSSTSRPDGGSGVQSDITGTNYYWAGGGGGAAYSSGTGGNGGAGGGGGGAVGSTSGGSGYNTGAAGGGGSNASQTNTPGGNGGANTGGGGGGGSHYNRTNQGGNGGSGIVVLRMPTESYSGNTTGSPTVSTDGNDTILIFESSGTYTS